MIVIWVDYIGEEFPMALHGYEIDDNRTGTPLRRSVVLFCKIVAIISIKLVPRAICGGARYGPSWHWLKSTPPLRRCHKLNPN